MRCFLISILLFFQLIGIAQDSLSTSQEATNESVNPSNTIPENLQLSHIEIKKQFIDFERLNDPDYRGQFTFGEALMESFDSLVPFYHYPNTLDLPHYLNELTFHFSAIEWKKPHKIKYSYYLEGLEKDWNPPTNKPKAAYLNLPSGSYSLKIKAAGESLIWSQVFDYSFHIRAPWWYSWWAYIFYASVMAMVGTYAFRLWQHKKLEAEQFQYLIEENRSLTRSHSVHKQPVSREGEFLNLVHQTLETHVSDENFGIAELCEILNISRTQLHRKLKKLTGLSASHYLRSLRLEIAKDLLEKTGLNVSEVAYRVGFSSPSYFSKVFKEEFGYAPKELK